jgi:cytochrome c553
MTAWLVVTALVAGTLAAAPALAQVEPPGSVHTLAATCALCHGADNQGVGEIEGLAGMRRGEFVDEMRELEQEPHEGRLMSVMVGAYSDAQIRALADHFAAQPGGARHDEDDDEHEENGDD